MAGGTQTFAPGDRVLVEGEVVRFCAARGDRPAMVLVRIPVQLAQAAATASTVPVNPEGCRLVDETGALAPVEDVGAR